MKTDRSRKNTQALSTPGQTAMQTIQPTGPKTGESKSKLEILFNQHKALEAEKMSGFMSEDLSAQKQFMLENDPYRNSQNSSIKGDSLPQSNSVRPHHNQLPSFSNIHEGEMQASHIFGLERHNQSDQIQ